MEMRKGRYIVFCAGCFIAGNFFGGCVPLPALFYFVASALLSLLCLKLKKFPVMLLAFFLLGAAGLQIGRIPAFEHSSSIMRNAAALKAEFSDYLSSIIDDGDELAVLRALAIGDKTDLSKELKSTYRAAGAMHLLALSGLHLGIIYATISLLLSCIGNSRPSRWFRSLSILSFLWFYAVVSGLSSSILRAVVMISVFEISGLMGATRDAPACIASSALLITIFSPEAPRDIGFQLSYSAVIAIGSLYPYLKGMLETRSRLLKFVWESVCIAISCQCTCGVLAWFYFGTFPRYFLVTNLLAVPVATLVMYLITITLLSMYIPQLHSISASLLYWTIHLLNTILELIAN